MYRIVSMILLSSIQNCCCYKVGKFTCDPPLHLDRLKFSYSFSPSKMTACPKLLKYLSRSMTPRGGMGRKKETFSESPLGFNRLYTRGKQHFTGGSLHQSPCSSGRHGRKHWWHWLLMQASHRELQTFSLLHVCPWVVRVKLLSLASTPWPGFSNSKVVNILKSDLLPWSQHLTETNSCVKSHKW